MFLLGLFSGRKYHCADPCRSQGSAPRDLKGLERPSSVPFQPSPSALSCQIGQPIQPIWQHEKEKGRWAKKAALEHRLLHKKFLCEMRLGSKNKPFSQSNYHAVSALSFSLLVLHIALASRERQWGRWPRLKSWGLEMIPPVTHSFKRTQYKLSHPSQL